MTQTFDLYNDKGEKVESGVASPLTHTGLAANTTYSNWKISYAGDTENLVKIPDFKTLKVAVTGISATPSDISVVAGQTAKVAISVQPSNATINAYDIKPDNESIATMDQDGTIHGIIAGKANFTITSIDDPSKSTIVAVTVTSATPAVPAASTAVPAASTTSAAPATSVAPKVV